MQKNNNPTFNFDYPCESHVDCYPISLALNPGTYKFQCYGASGGDSGNGKGGFGAYVAGKITLIKNTQLFLYIGAEGHTELGKTSFNGGGRAHIIDSTESRGASGGGGTDIRLENSSDIKGLLSRIMVAGGGGGGESYAKGAKGGDAGSYIGQNGSMVYKQFTNNIITVPKGGGQTSGGSKGECITNEVGCDDRSGHDGEFGVGGNASDQKYGGGGDGGYFGGGGGSIANYVVSSGAGGSSYVSGKDKCHSFKSNGANSIQDIYSSFHPSTLYFTSIIFQSGSEIQYKGNGKIIITYLNNKVSCNSLLEIKYNFLLLILIEVK